jgi:hypothetical protein
MIDRYSLLEKNPKVSEKIYGLNFDILKDTLKKVQLLYYQKLEENPISKRGLNAEFTFENQFLLTMEYLRGYQTFDVLAFSYGISKSYAFKTFEKIFRLLSEIFALKNPKKISFKTVKKAIVDVSCQPIERPKKEQTDYYNAHKKTILQKSKLL